VQHVEGRVAAIEHEHVACAQPVQRREQQIALAGLERREHDVVRDLGHDVHERAHEDLRIDRATDAAEAPEELLAALHLDAPPVDREDAAALPSTRDSEPPIRFVRHAMKSLAHGLGPQLAPRLAERRGRDRLDARKRDALHVRLVPEGLQQSRVAAPTGVADHEEEQRQQHLGREHALSSEAARHVGRAAP
jgi:hypothetical protein